MAAQFNSPPGWPKPPEGWTPPPGWAPDPSWPPAPQGWQFWIDDAAAAPPVAAPPDPQATQTMGTSPTQVLPTGGSASGGAGMYSYAASTGLDQAGASPYGGQGQPPGGYPGQGQYPQPGGPGGPGGPPKRNTGAIIAVVVVAVLVLAGLIWGLTALLGGGSDPDPTGTATSEPTSADSTTSEEPTSEEPTSEEPTSEEPTDDATTDDDGGDSGAYTDLTGDDTAPIMGYTATDPIGQIQLDEIVSDWQPDASSMLCGEPEQDEYLGLKFTITTTDALSQEDPPTYTFIGWEIGAQVDGVDIEVNGFGSGLFCLSEDQQFPSEMQPGETYEGWVILDVPDTVTAVTYAEPFDFSGDATTYRWVLADQ